MRSMADPTFYAGRSPFVPAANSGRRRRLVAVAGMLPVLAAWLAPWTAGCRPAATGAGDDCELFS